MVHNSRDNKTSIVMPHINLSSLVSCYKSVVKLLNVSAYGGVILVSFVLSMHVREMVLKESFLVVKSNGFLVYASQAAPVRHSRYP